MLCPFCGGEKTQVVDSRIARDQLAIRRRRKCEQCAQRFTTHERVDVTLPTVIKRDGGRETFQVAKIRAGIQHACQKRTVSAEDVEALIAEVERHYVGVTEREITSQNIGEAVLLRLRTLDEVAYVRFASVYREFSDVRQFLTELDALQRGAEND